MIRKTLTIVSLIGLLLSVGLWGVSYWNIHCFSGSFRIAVLRGNIVLQTQAPQPLKGHWFVGGYMGFYNIMWRPMQGNFNPS